MGNIFTFSCPNCGKWIFSDVPHFGSCQCGFVKINNKEEILMEKKPWYKSKTLWFNIGMFIITLAESLAGANVISGKEAAIATAVGNGILRLITKQPIGK